MLFAFPLALALLVAGLVVLIARFYVRGATTELPDISAKAPDRGGRLVMIVFFATVAAWLTEPFHGVSSAIVALISTAVHQVQQQLKRVTATIKVGLKLLLVVRYRS